MGFNRYSVVKPGRLHCHVTSMPSLVDMLESTCIRRWAEWGGGSRIRYSIKQLMLIRDSVTEISS